MSQKLVTIVGSTGTQGRAIITSLIKDPQYKIRGLTRNPDGVIAQGLRANGVEVVKADLGDPDSLRSAFAGSYAVFGVTDISGLLYEGCDLDAAATAEAKLGLNIAQACLETPGLEHFIWSTLPDVATLSDGTFDLPNFRGKVAVDAFIRSHPELEAKTTFLFIAQYHLNWALPPLAPHLIKGTGGEKGTVHVQFATHPPDTRIASIGDVSRNLGPFVAAILTQSDKTRGSTVLAHEGVYTAAESLQMWAKARGTRAISVPISKQQFSELFGVFDFLGTMWRSWAMLGDRAWTLPSGEKVLTKDDLGVTGLVGLEDSFASSVQGGQ